MYNKNINHGDQAREERERESEREKERAYEREKDRRESDRICVWKRERETDRQIDRERKREKERKRDRQRDRERESEGERFSLKTKCLKYIRCTYLCEYFQWVSEWDKSYNGWSGAADEWYEEEVHNSYLSLCRA